MPEPGEAATIAAARASASHWRRVGVYGCGLSGRAAAMLLRAHGAGVVVFDARPAVQIELTELAGDTGIDLRLGREPRAADAADLDAVVVSPGVPLDRPLLVAARQLELPIVAEVELAFRFLDGEVVALTGSNGKSTTTALTGALLARAGRQVEVCGNIGVPLAARALAAGQGRVFVVELSSFQLETVDLFHPRAAALLNLSDDHLDRHVDRAGYRAAKLRIFSRQTRADIAVINADDPQVRDIATDARQRWFSRLGKVEDGCYLAGETVFERSPGMPPQPLFQLADLRLRGLHNLENAMAAALLARAMGAEVEAVVDGLRTFSGLPHRLQLVASRAGIDWYDDSKGTNVGATARSLEGFAAGSVHLILGGRNKGADLTQLRPLVADKARHVYLIGEAAAELEGVLAGLPLSSVGTLAAAVELAAQQARPGDAVLLSPACASFDQFRSFVDRGQTFQRLVAQLEDDHG